MWNITNIQTAARTIMLFALTLFVALNISAQSALHGGVLPQARPSPSPAKTVPSPERRFFSNILRDQRAIWTSPFNLRRSDARWLAPLGISTAALLATDRRTAAELAEDGDNPTRLRISRDISYGGSIYTAGGIAATFYLIGRTTNNGRARETGLLGAEALIDGAIVSTGLKLISQRPRPRFDGGRGDFRDDGDSFPSGHATSAWALATVVANEYKRHRFVQVTAYGLATAVSISRYTGRNHFLSDVLVGSAIGYGIGRYVYRTHHDLSLDTDGSMKTNSPHSKLIPLVSPLFSRVSRSYGATLAWDF